MTRFILAALLALTLGFAVVAPATAGEPWDTVTKQGI